MKRQSEGEEGEVLIVEDVWITYILPLIGECSTLQLLPLCLVSKRWLWMTCQTTNHNITATFIHEDLAYYLLSERFGSKARSLVASGSFIPYICDHFTGIESLRLTKPPDNPLYKRGETSRLIHLKSLTLGEGTILADVEKLENLEHLSMLHIDNYTRVYSNITQLKKIRRLHVGRRRMNGGSHYSDSRLVFLALNHIPLSPDAVKLEFLETDSMDLFSHISYTGRGKWLNICTNYKIIPYYEGEWVNGKRHGKGVYECGGFSWKGEWDNGVLLRGTVLLDGGILYEGELVERSCFYSDVNYICAQGYGRLSYKEDFSLEVDFMMVYTREI